MNPSRILPDLQSSLVCDDIRQEVNGSFILIGVLGLIRVPKLPVTAFRLCVFNRWSAGVGQFSETVRLLAPDQTTQVRAMQTKFKLQDPAHHATNISVMAQVEFPTAGVYQVEVLVDDVMKIRYPLPVLVVPPPKQPGARAAAEGSPPSSAPPDPGSGDNPQP